MSIVSTITDQDAIAILRKIETMAAPVPFTLQGVAPSRAYALGQIAAMCRGVLRDAPIPPNKGETDGNHRI